MILKDFEKLVVDPLMVSLQPNSLAQYNGISKLLKLFPRPDEHRTDGLHRIEVGLPEALLFCIKTKVLFIISAMRKRDRMLYSLSGLSAPWNI